MKPEIKVLFELLESWKLDGFVTRGCERWLANVGKRSNALQTTGYDDADADRHGPSLSKR